MLDRQVINERALTGHKNEKAIPTEMRRAADDIEREFSRMYSDIQMDDKVRNINEEIDNKLKGRMKNGNGMCFLDNGDMYSGSWKDGKREGFGICKFYKGGYYKGEWIND